MTDDTKSPLSELPDEFAEEFEVLQPKWVIETHSFAEDCELRLVREWTKRSQCRVTW